MRRVTVLVLLALVAVVELSAQSVAVVARDLGQDDANLTVASLLVRRLEAELADRGLSVVDAGSAAILRGDPSDPRVTRVALDAIEESLDLVVSAHYRVDADSIVVQFLLVDPSVDIVVGGTLSRQRTGLTISASIDAAIEEFMPAVIRWQNDSDLLRRGPPPDKVDRIVVTGPQEDVRVRFAEVEIGSVSGGRVFVPYSPFPVGITVPVTLSKPGYHERVVSITLDSPVVEAALPPLAPASSMGLGLLWSSTAVRGAGVSLRLYPAPDRFYVAGEYTRFRLPEAGALAVGRSDLRFAAGLIFGPPEFFVRPVVEIGGGVLVSDVAEAAPLLDESPVYRDVYTGVAFGAELGLGRVRPFVRGEIEYALGFSRFNLLGNRWLSPPVTSLPVPVPTLTIGVHRTW